MCSTRPVTGVAITDVTTILRDKHWQVCEMTERTKAEDPVAAIRVYIDAFNKGDAKAMAASFASSGSILDGLGPHVWHGPTAAEDWYRDVLAAGGREGVTGYFVTVGEPLHANVAGDNAYVVLPASMTFKVHGQQVTQSGAIFTSALRKLADGWRITAWAWAKGTSLAT